MKRHLAHLLLCFTAMVSGQNYVWVVGYDYVAFWDGHQFQSSDGHRITSSAFDPGRCRVWVTEEKKQSLVVWNRNNISPSYVIDWKGRLVSDVENGFIYGIDQDGSLAKWDEEGRRVRANQLFSQPNVDNTRYLIQLKSSSDKQFWGLTSEEGNIFLNLFSVNFDLKQKVWIDAPGTIWPNPRFLFGRKGEIWIGYSKSGLGASSRLKIKLFSSRDFSWQGEVDGAARGLFFDFCLFDREDILVAYDRPTQPFTVPVYGYLDKLTPNLQLSSIYQSQLNFVIDSISCNTQEVWMAQRSLIGSDGVKLTRFDLMSSMEQDILRLPGHVRKIYSCE